MQDRKKSRFRPAGYVIMAAIVLSCISCSYDLAGGGTDVGNPDVTGYVVSNGKAAPDAMVILGIMGQDVGIVDTSYLHSMGDIVICFKVQGAFDTTYCNGAGEFTFRDVTPGTYTLVASKGDLLGMTKVTQTQDTIESIELTLETTAGLLVRALPATRNDSDSFIAARIDGTHFAAIPDTQGVLIFPPVPAGEFDIIFYRGDNTSELFTGVTTLPGCSSSAVIDPQRPSSQWTLRDCGARDPLDPPYLLWSSPSHRDSGAAGRVNYSTGYDVMLQFSHPMDTRRTGKAVHARGDSLIYVDSVWWQGSDVLLVRFTRLDGGHPLYLPGVLYSVVIDTLARSAFGVPFMLPETLSFVPEPKPRILKALIGQEEFIIWADSTDEPTPIAVSPGLIDTATPGASVIILKTTGRADSSSLHDGIACYAGSIGTTISTVSAEDSITITILDDLQPGTRYRIEISPKLLFENGLPYPADQVILWNTKP
jgi:hypothetical protein